MTHRLSHLPAPSAFSLRAAWLTARAPAVALIAVLLHMLPYWHAQSVTPPGSVFTGNVSASIDFIQYRAWMRQSRGTIGIVSNHFTPEPNKPHLPVFFYFLLGRISDLTGQRPEYVMAYAGALLAFLLVIVIYRITCEFFVGNHAWYVFLALVFGGGLGAHLKFLGRFDYTHQHPVLRRLIVEPIFDSRALVLEDYRGSYVVTTLGDTHYLMVYSCALSVLFYLLRALRSEKALAPLIAALLSVVAASFHIYQAMATLVIVLCVAACLSRKNLLTPHRRRVLAAAGLGSAAVLAFAAWLQSRSGIPAPVWREVTVPASMLFAGYPVAWVLLSTRLGQYWRRAGPAECFLVGWAAALALMTLSGPFYPYPARGLQTLAIPLGLIAARIFLLRFPVPRFRHLALVVLLLGATPAWSVFKKWNTTHFDPEARYMFLDRSERAALDLLKSLARKDDVLLAEEDDLRWLAPEYPGKHYCGHFFLTVEYSSRRAALEEFFYLAPDAQLTFLRQNRIRYVWVNRRRRPATLSRLPQISLLARTPGGDLYLFRGDSQ